MKVWLTIFRYSIASGWRCQRPSQVVGGPGSSYVGDEALQVLHCGLGCTRGWAPLASRVMGTKSFTGS